MMDWIARLFCIPTRIQDYCQLNKKTPESRFYNVFDNDPYFMFLVVAPILFGVFCISLVGVFGILQVGFFWPALILGLPSLIFGVAMTTGLKRTLPDEIANAQLVDNMVYTNCLVWAMQPLRSFARISGSHRVVKFAVSTQLLQTTGPSAGKSDDQKITLQLTYRLRIRDSAWTVNQNFLSEFQLRRGMNGAQTREHIEKVFQEVVEPQVIETISGVVDAPLQKHSVETFLTDVARVNQELLNAQGTLQMEIAALGVEIVQISVVQTEDVHPNGFITQRSKAVRAELESEARIRTANANLIATQTELANELEILKQQLTVLRQEDTNARNQAKIDYRKLERQIEVWAEVDTNAKAFWIIFEQVPVEHRPDFLKAIFHGLKPGEVSGSVVLPGGLNWASLIAQGAAAWNAFVNNAGSQGVPQPSTAVATSP